MVPIARLYGLSGPSALSLIQSSLVNNQVSILSLGASSWRWRR